MTMDSLDTALLKSDLAYIREEARDLATVCNELEEYSKDRYERYWQHAQDECRYIARRLRKLEQRLVAFEREWLRTANGTGGSR